jgi:hypothetical protein
VAATLAGAALLVAGTAVGQDDDFPFGPFRMFSTTDRLDAPVADTRLEAVDASGARLRLSDRDIGLRRAEIEGQLDRFTARPALLAAAASGYAARHPGAPPLVEIDVVVRWYELRDGRPTGVYRDQTVVSWRSG